MLQFRNRGLGIVLQQRDLAGDADDRRRSWDPCASMSCGQRSRPPPEAAGPASHSAWRRTGRCWPAVPRRQCSRAAISTARRNMATASPSSAQLQIGQTHAVVGLAESGSLVSAFRYMMAASLYLASGEKFVAVIDVTLRLDFRIGAAGRQYQQQQGQASQEWTAFHSSILTLKPGGCNEPQVLGRSWENSPAWAAYPLVLAGVDDPRSADVIVQRTLFAVETRQ